MKPGDRVRVLLDCPAGRWQAGELGTLEQHDFEKYDYFVRFDKTHRLPKEFGGGIGVRRFYFFANEVAPA